MTTVSFYLASFGDGGLALTVLFLSDLTTDEYLEELTDYRDTFESLYRGPGK